MTRTVRFRTAAGAAVVVAIALAVGAVVALAVQERTLRSNLDAALDQRAADLVPALQAGPLPPALAGRGEEAVAQLLDDEGRVVAASENLAGRPGIASAFTPRGGREARTVDGLRVGDNDRFRVVAWRFTRSDGVYTLYVGASLEPIAESVGTLRRSFAVGVPLMVLVVGWVTWFFVGRALGPVEAMRAEVAGITSAELHRRVPQPPVDDEIGRLARTMNAMLERLDAARRREHEFVANASHELRSPLANIRTLLEVDLSRPDEATPLATEQSVLEEAVRLQRLADDLLLLARGDAGAPMRREPVDLDDIVFREAERIRARRAVTIDTSGVSGAQVAGDEELLGRAVRNLLENAARYAREQVTVTLREHARFGTVALSVSDDGPGIPAEARERVFERFARLDEARTRAGGGTGLGLAIVREIVTRHGGTVTVDAEFETGARLAVLLPISVTAD